MGETEIRAYARELLDEASLYSTARPLATVSDLSDAFEVPLHVVRACVAEMSLGTRIGNTLALTRDDAIDLGEQLDADGWELGPEDEAEEDETDDEAAEDEDEDEE